jgi:hypothetical protein
MRPRGSPETAVKNLNRDPIACPETSVRDYSYTLRNKANERRFHLFRGGNLKSLQIMVLYILMFGSTLLVAQLVEALRCKPKGRCLDS